MEQANLLIFEPLGHGGTKVVGGEVSWTFWDSATCFLLAMDALNIKRAFVLGVSQGGFIATRMALYAPDRIIGIITVGTNLNTPGPELTAMGCADLYSSMLPVVTELTATANADFKIPEEMAKGASQLAIGSESEADVQLWASNVTKVYVGEVGRIKLRQTIIALLTRDGLHLRFGELKTSAESGTVNGDGTVPILYIRGTEDGVFSKEAAEKDIAALAKSGVSSVQFEEIQGGQHAANWNKAEEVNQLVVEFVKKYGGKKDARALREAVGMVDI